MNGVDLPDRLKRYDTRRLSHFDATTKAKDPRYRWFVALHGRRCWELDAMEPNVLRNRVRKPIESYIHWPLWQRAIDIEAAEVESMHDFHTAWQSRLTRTP